MPSTGLRKRSESNSRYRHLCNMSDKKKLLILVDWFHPAYKAGGPVQSCINVCLALKNQYEILVLTGDTDHGDEQPLEGIRTNQWHTHPLLGVSVYYISNTQNKWTAIATQIRQSNADFVYLNHMYSPAFVIWPVLLKMLGKIQAKMLLCPRGALYDSAIAVKRVKKIPLLKWYRWMGISRKLIFHATNEREKKAILHWFPGSAVVVADNLPAFMQHDLKLIPKTTGYLKLLFFSRIVPIKNLLFLLRALKTVTGTIELTIAGPVEDAGYWDACLKQAEELPDTIRIQPIGSVLPPQVPELMQQHHVLVLPTRGENFGHAIFESLRSGRPVLISDQTPWLHLSESNAGWDLPLNEQEAFSEVLQQLVQMESVDWNKWAKGSWDFAATYLKQQEQVVQQYYQLFQ